MEIERITEGAESVTLEDAAKDPGVYEDEDGDLILMANDGSSIMLESYDSLTPETYDERSTFRKLRTKLVILGMLLMAACQPAQDNGFLTACDDGAGPVDLEGDCYDVTWPSTPLTVGVAPGVDTDALDRAIDRWEHRRPFHSQDLFTTGADPRDSDVLIYRRAGGDPLGSASFLRMADGRLRAEVAIYNTASAAQLECVIFHELGHVLGLAHDDFGPMRVDACAIECSPSDLECTDDAVGLVDVRVTDGDHRRLGRVYE